MIKVKAAGTYITGITGSGELLDYEVEGMIGNCPEEWIHNIVYNRYVEKWINENKKNKKVQKLQTCEVISYEKVNDDDGVSGKDILTMDWEQLQLLVCRFPHAFLAVPHIGKGSLKDAQRKAAELYIEKIKGVKISEIEDLYKFDLKTNAYCTDWNGKKIIVDKKDEAPAEKKTISLDDVLSGKKKKSTDVEIEEIS